MSDGQLTLDSALSAVDAAANAEWKRQARLAIRSVAFSGRAFTTDEVWDAIGDQTSTHDGRALGPLIREAAAEGLIVPTGRYRTSGRARCHQRPVREWVMRSA